MIIHLLSYFNPHPYVRDDVPVIKNNGRKVISIHIPT